MSEQYFEENIEIPRLKKGDKIFHYTSAAGLQGIIENKEFWITECLFLNDTTEFKIGKKIIEEVLESNISKKQILNAFLDLFHMHLSKNLEDKNYYIISFCLDEDSPLMWAAYSNFMGYSLKFDFDKLLHSFDIKKLEHGKVIYNHEEQKNLVEKTINHYFFKKGIINSSNSILNNIVNNLKNWDDFNDSIDEIHLNLYAIILAIICEYYNMFFKKESFKGEHEYRFIFPCTNESNDNDKKWFNVDIPQKFRIKNETLIPYIKCKIKEMNFLEGVIVGPKNNSDIAVRGIEYFLKSKGIDVLVKKSELPLRY